MLLFAGATASAQSVTMHGTIFNRYRTKPLEAVTVMSTSGRGTTTDSNGNYEIVVRMTDSLSFSYLGRTTARYPVKGMNQTTGFDLALHVNPQELNTVTVAPRNYHIDSLRNRQEYQKNFDYHKPGLGLSDGSSGSGVGIDLDQLIDVFAFAKKRRAVAFQGRLIYDEENAFVDHRFNRSVVRKITLLRDSALDDFMARYRPTYEFSRSSNDYDFYQYIKICFEQYEEQIRFREELRKQK